MNTQNTHKVLYALGAAAFLAAGFVWGQSYGVKSFDPVKRPVETVTDEEAVNWTGNIQITHTKADGTTTYLLLRPYSVYNGRPHAVGEIPPQDERWVVQFPERGLTVHTARVPVE
jgi:hypothetical protein